MKPFQTALPLLLALATIFFGGCRGSEQPAAEPSSAPAAPVAVESAPGRAIVRLHPAQSVRGTPINRQPDGRSALSVEGTGFVRGDQIHWDGDPLKTVFGSETGLTAEVPDALLDRVGDVTITIKNPADPESREVRATFRLLAAAPGDAE